MKIDNITVSAWSTGQVLLTTDGGTNIHMSLTEEESNQIRVLATDFFLARQQEIAKDVANSRPALLGDFSEVQPAPADTYDDVPF